MPSDLVLSVITGVCLILLLLLTRWRWRCSQTATATATPRPKREPKPFAGYSRKPACPVCEHEAGCEPSASAPHAPPPRMIFTRGQRRQIDVTGHLCPHAPCSYPGRVGWGNIRANGHPNGRRWRQLVCLGCKRHFLETHSTPFHGKQVEPDELVWAIAAKKLFFFLYVTFWHCVYLLPTSHFPRVVNKTRAVFTSGQLFW